MNIKKQARLRRALKSRSRIKLLRVTRLCVHRTPQHIYAQIITPAGDQILVSASTLDKEIRQQVNHGGNIKAAEIVGKVIAERAVKAGVTEVAFDRSGFQYHGRVKALADSARAAGLQF